MGRSAKLHKRVAKKTRPSTGTQSAPTSTQVQVQNAKKKATLKDKAAKGKSNDNEAEGVLGGADYVSLMMGGRRKAKQEAEKLPQDDGT